MRRIMLLLTALLLPIAACGDDDEGSTGSPSGPEEEAGEAPVALEGDVNNKGTAQVEGDSIEMELDDFYFGPTFVQAEPGATVTVTLTNEGEQAHTFTSDSLGLDEEFQPGDSRDVDVLLPESGATLFYCRFHQSQGMQGAFFFEPGDTVESGAPNPYGY